MSEGSNLAEAADELDAVHLADAENFEQDRDNLGPGIELTHQLIQGYNLLREAIQTSPNPIDEKVITTGVHFILWCQYHCTMAVIALLRGHRNDGLTHLRRGVEGVAFAARIKRHPDLADAWLNARKSEDAFRAYKRKFGTAKLFPDDDKTLDQLRDIYETTNPFSHPSLSALAGHVEMTSSEDGGFEAKFKYHQFDTDDAGGFLRTYLYAVRTNRLILDVFAQVFPEAIAPRTNEWALRINALDASLRVNAQRWRHLILGGAAVDDPTDAALKDLTQ